MRPLHIHNATQQMMDPDEHALEVLDQILNGFGGRLFNQIRSREGLAYSVSGGWANTPIDHPGLFLATAETAQPGALLAALRGALEQAAAAPPSADELQRAKQETLNKCGWGGRHGRGGWHQACVQQVARPRRLLLWQPHAMPPCCAVVFNFGTRPAQLQRIIVFDLLVRRGDASLGGLRAVLRRPSHLSATWHSLTCPPSCALTERIAS